MATSNQRMTPLEPRERRKRKRELIAFVGLLALFIVLTVAEFRLSSVSSSLPFVNSIFFFGLLNINILILVTLCWLVFRNLGKVFIERRRKVLGSALKTKLVIAFLGFSIIPTLTLFVISALYINSSFDKWFSIKIQNTLQSSLEITGTYYRNAHQAAMHFAEHIAQGIGHHPGTVTADSPWLQEFLESQRDLLALDGVEYYPDPLDERLVSRRILPEGAISYPRLSQDLLDRAFGGEKVPVTQHVGSGDLIRCLVPVSRVGANGVTGVVVVDTYIPVSLVNKVDEISSVFDDYKEVNPLKYPMKTMYFVILVMITLVILFVAIWIGLYMARELTVPLQRLVFGAQAVGAGNLDITIAGAGHDEIAVLVESFNKMTRDLKDNQVRLTQASADLQKRRLQLEAVLANVGTGVIVVDRSGEISTYNRAVASLLKKDPNQVLGKRFDQVLTGDAAPLVEAIDEVLKSRPAQGLPHTSSTQWNITDEGSTRTFTAIATPLWDPLEEHPWGTVVVIDDMTHLIKGQREMAWREVARRIAHEIKNPLTPIKLSAQRLQRKMGNYRGREAELLQECTETIIKHTDELKEMVNEFSNFARFPEASPAPHDLNGALKEVVTLFEQAHPQIAFQFDAESKLPIFEFDRDQIKRVMINLLDNSVAALNSLTAARAKNVKIETYFNERLHMAVIKIQDNGPGMSEGVRDRVFEPYFSTKSEGTGLGLAITKRIINDHDGFIRVQSAPGEGTLFSIELPTSRRNGLAIPSPRVEE